MKTIDLNADVGEGAPWDADLIPLTTSVNIACGGHAGDERTMEAAARLAIENGVAIGAHPGHEDREHFGRRELPITPAELKSLITRQTDRLMSIVEGLGGKVRHVKLHGALYHQTSTDRDLAEAAVDALIDYHSPIALYCRFGTEIQEIAFIYGIDGWEAFPDRLYLPDGSLAPRSNPEAMILDTDIVAKQAIRLAEEASTLCLHGDEPGVVERAHAVREALTAEGYALRSFTA